MPIQGTTHIHAQADAVAGDRQRRQVKPRVKRPGGMIADKKRVEPQLLRQAPRRQQVSGGVDGGVNRKDVQREGNSAAMLLDPG